MMPSLWFIVPAHGRLELSRICLTQLRRTCDELTDNGVDASAVVVACDENLDTARELDFTTYERDNRFTSRRFNDGIQAACDPRFNPRPADYVVPFGSDDWADWKLFLDLPPRDTMYGFQRMAFVREDGLELDRPAHQQRRRLRHPHLPAAGDGTVGVPARRRAPNPRLRHVDPVNLRMASRPLRVVHRDIDPLQIVDWKSPGANLNPYASLRRHREELRRDPFEVLKHRYPDEALDEMAAFYSKALLEKWVAA